MHYYQELTLIKNSEISSYFIWSKLYLQLHLAFVEQKDANEQIPYGVSFPEFKTIEAKNKHIRLLGSKLRVFAESVHQLEALNLDKWLAKLTDYVHIKSPRQVEKTTYYLTVNRFRSRPNPDNLARRYARRHGVSIEDALKRLEGYKRHLEPYPFIQLKSLSEGDKFSLCINQQLVEKPTLGKFSTYGLSATSTVPHW